MKISNVCFNTGQIHDGNMYCSSTMFNGLLKVNVKTGETQFLQTFPDEKCMVYLLHRECFKYKNKIGFVPQNGKGVSVYDCDTGKMEFVSTEIEGRNYPMLSCVVGSTAWLFPIGRMEILALDLETYRCQIHKNIQDWEAVRAQRVFLKNGKIWISQMHGNTLAELDVQSMQVKQHTLDVQGIYAISEARNGIWIITDKCEAFYLWNVEKNELSRFEVEIPKMNSQMCYSDIVETEDGAFAIPMYFTPILYKGKGETVFRKVYDFESDVYTYNKALQPFFVSRLLSEDGWIMFPYNTNKYGVIDVETNGIQFRQTRLMKEIEISNDVYVNYLKSASFKEGLEMNFEDYIKGIATYL